MYGEDAEKMSVPEVQVAPKVYAPLQADQDGHGSLPRLRVTLPRHKNFFEGYPLKWTWDSWGKRAEMEWLLVARGIEAVAWGALGGLLGLAASAVPGAFLDRYSFVVWQPMGSAIGATTGAVLVWLRWRSIFRSHQDMSRSAPRD